MMEKGSILEDRFKVIDLIGQGGMGRVWQAIDLSQPLNVGQRKVAIKEIREDQIADERSLKRFANEINALAMVSHPHIIKYIKSGWINDKTPYLAMEFFSGQPLRNFIRQHGLTSFAEIATIMEQLGSAMEAAHRSHIYHRDLNPANILLSYQDGEPFIKVIDFGLATIKKRGEEPTRSTTIMGTEDYMAPEQIEGRPSASSDIYAMGVVAYEMISGRKPYDLTNAGAPLAILYELQQKAPNNIISLCKLRLNMSKKANALVLQSLSHQAKDRPQSAQEFADSLATALRDEDDYYPLEERINSTINHSINSSKHLTKNSTLWLFLVTIPLILIAWQLLKLSHQPSPSSRLVYPVTSLKDKITPILIRYSISLNKYTANNSYQPAINLTAEEIILHKNDLIKLNFVSTQPCYIYIIDQLPTNNEYLPHYKLLFPLPQEDNHLKPGIPLVIPSQDDDLGFQVKGLKGAEKIWIICSRERDPVCEKLILNNDYLDDGLINNRNSINQLQHLLATTNLIKSEYDQEKRDFIITGELKTNLVTIIKLVHK